MIQQTRGIVLQRFKYSDSKVIAKLFTEKFGLISCMFYGTTGKRGQDQIRLLQPMYMVDISVYFKENANFQKVKEIAFRHSLLSISMNVVKNTICGFLAEFLLKTLKENDADEQLFNFLDGSVKILNDTEGHVQNFHLIFLFKLTKFLGIMPLNTFSESNAIFDLKSGKFITGIPNHPYFLNLHQSTLFSKLFVLEINDSRHLDISNSERGEMLNALIDYYNNHLDRPGELKSLKILKEVFS